VGTMITAYHDNGKRRDTFIRGPDDLECRCSCCVENRPSIRDDFRCRASAHVATST
jgi:hypothetical protein